MSAPANPPAPETFPAKRPQKKLHLWMLAGVTYALVIILTVFAVWSYRYLDAKTHRDRNAEGTGFTRPLPSRAPNPVRP